MNIAIFGANGYIGSHLSNFLATKKNLNIYCFVRENSNTSRLELLKHKYKNRIIQIIKYSDDDLINGNLNLIKYQIKILINLISYGVLFKENDESKAKSINIELPKILFKSANNNHVNHFIHFGTSQEYENTRTTINELSSRYSESIYGRTKSAGCDILHELQNIYKNTKLLIIRPFSIFGEYEDDSKLLPSIIISILKNRKLKLTAGDQERNYLYIDNFNNIIYLLINKINSLKFNNYNVGSSKNITVKEISTIINHYLNSDSKILQWGELNYRKNEILKFEIDLSRLKNELNVNLNYDINQGIKKLVNFYLKESH